MLKPFAGMWNGPLKSIKLEQYRTELDKTDSQPIHSAPYRAGPKEREFRNRKIDQVLAMDGFEISQTEWVSPTVISHNEDGTHRFCVEYHKLKAVTIRNSCPIQGTD